MNAVTISLKFQILICKRIRDKLRLSRGEKVQAVLCGDRIELLPVRPIRQMRRFLKGLDTSVDRSTDRE